MGRVSYDAKRWYDQPGARVMMAGAGALILLLTILVAPSWGGGVPDSVRQDAHSDAQYYCSFQVGAAGIYSDVFRNCVDAETQSRIDAWQAKH